jgi:hypothetical protein
MRKSSNRVADDLSAREVWARRARHHRGAHSASASGPATVTLLGQTLRLPSAEARQYVARVDDVELRAWPEGGRWFAVVRGGDCPGDVLVLACAQAETLAAAEPLIAKRLAAAGRRLGATVRTIGRLGLAHRVERVRGES